MRELECLVKEAEEVVEIVEIVWGIHDKENIWWDSRNVEIVGCGYEDVASMSWQ